MSFASKRPFHYASYIVKEEKLNLPSIQNNLTVNEQL